MNQDFFFQGLEIQEFRHDAASEIQDLLILDRFDWQPVDCFAFYFNMFYEIFSSKEREFVPIHP